MDVFLRIDLNLFALIICVGMFIININFSEKHLVNNLLFRMLILSTAAELALEIASRLLAGQPGAWWKILNDIDVTLAYLLVPAPAFLWALYVSYQLFHDMRRLKKTAAALLIPIVLCDALTAATPWTGMMFTIGNNNVYQRGPFFWLLAATALLPIAYSAVICFAHLRRVSPKLSLPLLFFMVPSVICAVLQIMFYGITVLWSGTTLSIFIVYAGVQCRQFYLDHLTGVFNRRQLDNHLYDCIQSARPGKSFSCIMLDIDNFKTINDSYGHITGDEALMDAARILKQSIRQGDFLARYAGDEFMIVLDISDVFTLEKVVRRIRKRTVQYMKASLKPFRISFSAGYAVYDPSSGLSKDEFIAKVDHLMYREKNMKKLASA